MAKVFEMQPGQVAEVPLGLIDFDPKQPRTTIDDDYIAELSADIKVNNVKQPITLRPNPEQPGRFFIKYGECRYRASELAKKKTIRSLLDEEEVEGKVDDLTRLLDQAKENHLRKDLNAMDWAFIFKQMKVDHKLKIADIEATLKSHNVGQFGRAYISNIMRLVELPEWAQLLIRKDILTGAHGKYLLQAMAGGSVLTNLRSKFMNDDWQPTTKELQQEIYWQYAKEHKNLTSHETQFDYKEKCADTGCQKMRKVSAPNGMESTFCLDKDCHRQYSAEARAAHEEEMEARQQARNDDSPVDVKGDDNNVVDVNQMKLNWNSFYPLEHVAFDISTCDGCPNRHIAKWTDDDEDDLEEGEELEYSEDDSCFHRACLDAKEDQYRQAKKLVKDFIRDRIAQQVKEDQELTAGLMIWIASGCPCGVMTDDEEGEMVELNPMDLSDGFLPGQDPYEFEKLLFSQQLTSFSKFAWEEVRAFQEIAVYAVHKFNDSHLAELLPHFKITIDDYRIDENYLAKMTEDQIRSFLSQAEFNLPPVLFAEVQNAEGLPKLIELAVSAANHINVPGEIRWAFAKLTEED